MCRQNFVYISYFFIRLFIFSIHKYCNTYHWLDMYYIADNTFRYLLKNRLSYLESNMLDQTEFSIMEFYFYNNIYFSLYQLVFFLNILFFFLSIFISSVIHIKSFQLALFRNWLAVSMFYEQHGKEGCGYKKGRIRE